MLEVLQWVLQALRFPWRPASSDLRVSFLLSLVDWVNAVSLKYALFEAKSSVHCSTLFVLQRIMVSVLFAGLGTAPSLGINFACIESAPMPPQITIDALEPLLNTPMSFNLGPIDQLVPNMHFSWECC